MQLRPYVVIAWAALAGCGRFDFDAIARDGAVVDVPPDEAVVVPGLVVAYPADELAGGVAPSTAAGYDGACTTCPTLTTGVHGNAYAFDGAACIDLPAISTSLVGAAPYTVSVWVHSRDGAQNTTLVAKPYGGASFQDVLALNIFSGGPTLETTSTGADFLYLDGASKIDMVGWHFLAARWDGWTLSLAVDGIVTSSTPLTTDVPQPLVFGCDRDGGIETHFFIGDLDDLRFYDRALSDAELAVVAGG